MINGFIDLPELQHKIEELQGIKTVKPRIASLDHAHKLLEEGYDTAQALREFIRTHT